MSITNQNIQDAITALTPLKQNGVFSDDIIIGILQKQANATPTAVLTAVNSLYSLRVNDVFPDEIYKATFIALGQKNLQQLIDFATQLQSLAVNKVLPYDVNVGVLNATVNATINDIQTGITALNSLKVNKVFPQEIILGLLQIIGNLTVQNIQDARTLINSQKVSNLIPDSILTAGLDISAALFHAVDISGIIPLQGQSLSIGLQTTTISPTTVSPNTYTFDVGSSGGSARNGNTNAAVAYQNTLDGSVIGETILNMMSRELTLLGSTSKVFVCVAGESGVAYDGNLNPGSGIWTRLLTQISNAIASSNAAGLSSNINKPICLPMIHGESDSVYDWYYVFMIELLRAFRDQYNDQTLKMFMTQTAAWTSFGTISDVPLCGAAIAQYRLAKDYPNDFVLVCSNYLLATADGVHINAASEQRLGEYFGNLIYKVLSEKKTFRAITVSSIIATNTVGSNYSTVITFNTPFNTALYFDTSIVSNPGNYGFEILSRSGANCTIGTVTLSNNQVTITTTSGIPFICRYAYKGVKNNFAGPTTGPRGNLFSADTFPSVLGNTNRYVCPTFSEYVTNSTPETTLSNLPTTNLVGHWDGDTGITIDGSDNITSWTSLSGETTVPVLSSSANWFTKVPNALNGKAIAAFQNVGQNAVTHISCTLGTVINLTSGFAVFFIVRTNGQFGDYQPILSLLGNNVTDGTTPGDTITLFPLSNGLLTREGNRVLCLFFRGDSNGLDNRTELIPEGQWLLLSIRGNSADNTFSYWINGEKVYSKVVTSVVSNTLKTILPANKSVGGTNYQPIDMAALTIYKDSLTDQAFADVNDYLLNKFALQKGFFPTQYNNIFASPANTLLASLDYAYKLTVDGSCSYGSKPALTLTGTPTFDSTNGLTTDIGKYVLLPNSAGLGFDGTQDFTITMWVRAYTNSGITNHVIFSKGTGLFYFYIQASLNYFWANFISTNNTTKFVPAYGATANTLYFVALVYDATTHTLKRTLNADGAFNGVSQAYPLKSDASNFYIGGDGTNSSKLYCKYFHKFNKKLNPNELKYLYNKGTPLSLV